MEFVVKYKDPLLSTPHSAHLSDTAVSCPFCGSEQVEYLPEQTTIARRTADKSRHELSVPYRCGVKNCSHPFFAIYDNARFKRTSPPSHVTHEREEAIDLISPDFYAILDQAATAEAFGLTLISGAGYRKALEFLVKDYMVYELRQRSAELQEKGDTAGVTTIDVQILKLLRQQLGGKKGLISQIDDKKLKTFAERATWLGNDETHYLQKWDNRIVELRDLIDLTVAAILSESHYRIILHNMPEGR